MGLLKRHALIICKGACHGAGAAKGCAASPVLEGVEEVLEHFAQRSPLLQQRWQRVVLHQLLQNLHCKRMSLALSQPSICMKYTLPFSIHSVITTGLKSKV